MQLFVRAGHAVMLVGKAGCGKSSILSNLLAALKEKQLVNAVTVACNYYTTSPALQASIEGHLEKKAGSLFGPAGSIQRLAVFLDDLNMPEVRRVWH